MNFIAVEEIISGKQLDEFLRLAPKHSCTDGHGAWLTGPRNGTIDYIQIGERSSVLSVCYDGWQLWRDDGRAPIRVRYCPWCGEELPVSPTKARKITTAELQAAHPHLSVIGTENGIAW